MKCIFEGEFADIPDNLKASLVNYVEHHIPPGSFMTAMIQGDLFRAIRRADLNSRKNIPLVALWLDGNIPGLCGPENMKEHLGKRA